MDDTKTTILQAGLPKSGNTWKKHLRKVKRNIKNYEFYRSSKGFVKAAGNFANPQ